MPRAIEAVAEMRVRDELVIGAGRKPILQGNQSDRGGARRGSAWRAADLDCAMQASAVAHRA